MKRLYSCSYFRKTNRGAAMVEFVIAAPVFFLVLFLAIEFAILSYRAAALQYTVSTATRWAVLGETIGGTLRVPSIKQKLQEIGSRFGLSIEPDDIHICPLGVTSCLVEDAGSPEEYIQITAVLPMQLMHGSYDLNLKVSIMGRNEPYL